MINSRKAIALMASVVLCILAVTPFALAINRFDWGVVLLLVAPLLVWLLLRAGRAMERWARNEDRSPPPDPDFPDEPP
jgi:apolipoprotein N-acyltransferase